jgi:hypothetical protein
MFVPSRGSARVLLVVGAVLLVASLSPAPAQASFPGQNGSIVHVCRFFDSNGASHWEICLSKPDGTGQRYITDTRSPRTYWDPAWSPDGKWIAYGATIANAYDNDIWVMKPGDPSSARNVTLTPNASDGSSWYTHSTPSWSRTGTKLVFVATYVEDSGQESRSGIWTINVDGTDLRLIYPIDTAPPMPKWSPTADRIIFECIGQAWDEWTETWRDNQEVCSIKPDGTGLQNLTKSLEGEAAPADWSPDGTKIVFTRYVPGTGWPGTANIWVMNADGTGQHQVFGDGTTNGSPVWSPDGMKILFGASVWNEFGQLDSVVRMMDADGTDMVEGANQWGSWQPCTPTTGCDFTPPNTLLDQKPAAATSSTSATFAFHASEADSSFECSLDSGGFASCDSPITYMDLYEADHTFEVRAVDGAANADSSPAQWHWTVDATPPGVYIADYSTVGQGARFTLDTSTGESGVTYLCSLDGSAFATCTSPVTYSHLAPGQRVFRAKGRDAAGNVDADSAEHTWQVAKLATTTTISVTVQTKIVATGKVTPAHPGVAMTVRLERKNRNGVWALVTRLNPVLSTTSTYKASFARPAAGSCRAIAKFPGDADHKTSSKTSGLFNC